MACRGVEASVKETMWEAITRVESMHSKGV